MACRTLRASRGVYRIRGKSSPYWHLACHEHARPNKAAACVSNPPRLVFPDRETLNIRPITADLVIEMLDDESSVLSALRREPEQTALLLKLTAVMAIVLVAWDVAAAMVLPMIAVKAVLVLLLLAYGAAMTYLVARIMASSRSWASGSAAAATKLSASNARGGASTSTRSASPGIDVAALRRRPNELPLPPEDSYTPVAAPAPSAPAVPEPIPDASAFNESYFLMRLQEQVKDARRQGHEMCVAAVHVTIPGVQITPDIAETVAYEMARIASGQARIMSQPLALSDSEYVFSLPHTGPDETRQFVREIMRALGDYWCYFGIASFPHSAHDAHALVDKARAACEASLQSGKRGQVEYSAA